MTGTGAGERPTARVEIPAGQGVQVGDGNIQDNKFIQTYVEQQVIQAPSGPVAGPVVAGEVPQQPPAFQMRPELLAALRDSGPGVVVVRAVTGMRGVGKTQLAAAHARSCIDASWRLVAWVNAEELGGLLAGLAEVATALGVGAEDARVAGRAVRHWLEVDGERCLVVFDNATDPGLLRPFIPAAGAARVIITSNRQSVAYLGAGVPVDVFSEQEALTFLAARTGHADGAGAQALAEDLGCLPLALAQAAAVIASQHLTYDTYLARLRRLPVGDLLVAEEAGEYPRGVAAAMLLSLDAVRAVDDNGACMAVMELVAVLSPSGVRRSLLHEAAGQNFLHRFGQSGELTVEAVDRALARLAGMSLLTFSLDGSSVSAHRLVMRVIREQLVGRDALTVVCGAAMLLFRALADSLESTWHENRSAARDLVEQIIALHESSAGCQADSDFTLCMMDLRSSAFSFLTDLGDSPARAIMIGEPLLADQGKILGFDHPETVDTRNVLAGAFCAAGRTAEAITLVEQVLAIRERALGADHPDTMAIRNNLAAAYNDAGRTAESIDLLEQVLADRERVLGADHPDTMSTRNSLAKAYLLAERAAEAIDLLEQTLADRERVLGVDHPDTLMSRHNVAIAYLAVDDWPTAAIDLLEQVLADRERVLGADHPDTITTRNFLAKAIDYLTLITKLMP
jgi:tetratricopeptide (TPR) repeat protein